MKKFFQRLAFNFIFNKAGQKQIWSAIDFSAYTYNRRGQTYLQEAKDLTAFKEETAFLREETKPTQNEE